MILPKQVSKTLDDVAPYFKTEPGPPQTHLEGNRLVLTCLAEGSWPLEFKWMLNNSDITSFSPEYKYSVASLQRSDAGFYQCVVRNRRGALMQRKTEVHVAFMGSFAEQEQRKTVSQGRAAVLNPPAVSSYPRPQVTWFRDGYKIIPSYRVKRRAWRLISGREGGEPGSRRGALCYATLCSVQRKGRPARRAGETLRQVLCGVVRRRPAL
ncbi:hypothetical protein ANANG_G00038780 [Anguilla anguilla]|uniref:Ig-like domain-containing protein n=1 Tax=Anguilla anguilla TaxID=7936 RepID=A0A9D3MT77_ANGAN|nr:hypothetical protein ANANG_G00038780 [Anguilla anguilla]